MDEWLSNITKEIQLCQDLQAVKSSLVKIKRYLEFTNVTYAIKLPAAFTRSEALIISDYPDKWLERYGERGYANIDPVVQHCFKSQTPCHWGKLSKGLSKDVRAFMTEARDFGLIDGISIGMPRFDGDAGLFSLASNTELNLSPKQYRQIIIYLNALQPFIHEQICYIENITPNNRTSYHLTDREKGCLVWAAEGKTAHDIASILSISETTVVFHLKNCIQKLNVSNRSQAVAKAVLLGLVIPQFPEATVSTRRF